MSKPVPVCSVAYEKSVLEAFEFYSWHLANWMFQAHANTPDRENF